jgi:glycyl-tRNA synthetase beta chain
VANILKNQESVADVEPSLFQDPTEPALWNAYLGVRDKVRESADNRDYLGALNLMARLRKPVDAFFEGVEVLTKSDPSLRNNRVAMLQAISVLLTSVADFSKFAV